MLSKEFESYINEVMSQIRARQDVKEQFRLSLTEHVEALIEQHGSMAVKYLTPPDQVATDFMENLDSEECVPEIHQRVVEGRYRYRYPNKRQVSEKKIFGMPLYHITDGYNPETGKFEIAKGFFAVGPISVGVFSLGGIAFGGVTFGGVSTSLILALGGSAISGGCALGGFAAGGLLALGAGAFSAGIAVGDYARGLVAIGNTPIGEYIYNTATGMGNAREWFQQYLPFVLRWLP